MIHCKRCNIKVTFHSGTCTDTVYIKIEHNIGCTECQEVYLELCLECCGDYHHETVK